MRSVSDAVCTELLILLTGLLVVTLSNRKQLLLYRVEPFVQRLEVSLLYS